MQAPSVASSCLDFAPSDVRAIEWCIAIILIAITIIRIAIVHSYNSSMDGHPVVLQAFFPSSHEIQEKEGLQLLCSVHALGIYVLCSGE